ncbi:T9SS type A sorting domain-containing protein [Marivirga arenosa]|uniref:T9SS type A sorting domain-containing protein n=1 Tax=Marivirga arenosa TaxID=3059076 RepID=A0AA51R901_9BACT|nr:T9SS type A sorting domain-containing protein [Marivirga sp. ABR2-2]WMN07161.1 T9SS type A sorting domain-containing protein [Marivirga sp. ABR2-2]
MKKFYLLAIIFICSITSNIFGQSGPAGIGNADGSNGQPETIYWLEAGDLGLNNNDPVSNWNDKSGNSNNLSQSGTSRPTFKNASDANYDFSAVSFDGTDDFLPFDGNLLVGTDYTILLVGTRKSNGREVIMGGSVGATNQNLHPYFNTGALHSHHWGNDHNAGYTGGDGSTANATTPNFGIFGFRLNSSLGTAQRALYQNGRLIGTRNNNAQLSAFVDAAIGRFEAVGEFSDIEIAELIIYSDALNEAQQVLVQNYLSSKYDITLDDNEFYAGDTPANGNYDFNVIGIGQQSGDQILTNSNSGFYLTGDGTLDANGEFVMFGDDNSANAVSTSNLGATVQERWAKTWYLDKTGTLNATIGFNISEGIPGGLFPAGDVDNYVLLRENAGTFDIVPIAAVDKSLNAGRIEFIVSDADLLDGIYTLGTTNNTDSPVAGQPNQTWYSRLSGDWNDPNIWTLDGSATPLPNNPGNEIPDATDNVVINNATTVTLINDNRNVTDIEVIGTLDIANTSGHNFTNIRGNGRIRLAGAAGIGNFPQGNTTDFADNFIGGTVEYYGTGLTVNENRVFNDVIINLDNNTDDLVLMADLLSNGDLTIISGDLQINDNLSTTIKALEVNGTLFVDTNGAISVGTGNTIGTFSINANNMPSSGNYHNIYHQVIIKGDFINQGNVRFTNQASPVYNEFTTTGAATVRFEGATNNTASLFGTTDFYNLVVDKGTDETFEIEINSDNSANFSLFGPNDVGRNSGGGFTAENPEIRKALWIYRGTLHLSGDIIIPTLSEGNRNGGNGDYAIGATAGLWIDGPNVEVYSTADNAGQVPAGAIGVNGGGSNQALSLYGKFRITDGFFGTRASAGFIFWNADAGEVLIEGGTVNVSQFRSAGGGNGIYSYTQSGGDVLVRANEGQPGETSGTYSLFSLDTEDAVFNMSGGTLTVYGNRGEAIFINSGPGNFSVTGGTVRVENRNGTRAIVSTRVPFWDFEVARDQAGDADEVDLITSTSGGNTITNPELIVLNNFTIEQDINFDHNGNDVTIGSDFTIEAGGDYEFAGGKRNTTSFIGTDNATLTFLNRTGGTGDEQRFWNVLVDRPSGKTLSFESGKTNRNGNNNNLFRIDGDFFKVLSGTVDQGTHSIRMYADTLLNYDEICVFNPLAINDADPNGRNDIIKFRDDGGPATVLITADTSRFGAIKLNSDDEIFTLNSDLQIDYLDYRHGRFNLQSNNLTINILDNNLNGTADFDVNQDGAVSGGTENGIFSPADMIITSGNASDGGLSLLVTANGTYTFPLGIGTDATRLLRNNSKYTPVTVEVTGLADAGYITIRPVDRVLSTTDGTGGDILSYYWKIDSEGFNTPPNVEYSMIYYDEDLDGSANEGTFVAGKVLEQIPFTRNYEDDGDAEFEGVDVVNNTITFNGPNPDSGFPLENASYTAGESGRFVGAPTIYYSSTAAVGNNTDFNRNDRWNQSNRWSTVGHYSTVNTGTFPQPGDVAIMAFGLQNANSTVDNAQRSHWYYLNADGGAAKLIFSETVENANGDIVVNDASFQPQLIIAADNALDVNFGTVEGNGTFNVELDCAPCNIDPNSSTVVSANITADFGLFADVEAARFDFDLYSNNNTSVYMPTDITSVFPNLQIKGQGGNGRRLVFESDVTINRDLVLREGGFLRLGNQADGDVTVGRNLNMTTNNDGDVVEFPLDGPGRVLTINGDINMDNNNDEITFRDNNNAGDVTINRLRVGGNINQETGQINLYSGAGPNRDQVELEVFGETDAEYTRTNNPIASLYRLILNKGNNRSTTFTFQDNFSLNGETDGTEKALELQNGTLILNDNAIDIDLTTGGDSFVIPATASLQITQGLANIGGDDSGIILDGALIIDGGTLDMTGAGNGNNFIEYSASGNAVIEVSDGSLLVGSQIRGGLGTTAGVLKYRQTGGIVEVGVNAAPEADRSVFEIRNEGSEFTYTAGDLIVRRQNTGAPTVAAIRILPTDFSISRPIIIRANDTGQGNIGINANVPLAGLTIEGVNNPTVITNVNALELNGDLDIQNGASFNANGIDLLLNSDLINNGTFTASGNNTQFLSSISQNISGANPVTFFEFTKNAEGTLNLVGNPIVVNGLFSHESGVINDNGNIIDLKSNAVIEGEISSAAGGALVFSGATQQQLQRLTAGVTDLGVVTISNPSGVIIPEGNGYNFTINGDLEMNGGIFNIGSSSVVIGQNADITTNSSFSVTNMVRTNSSFTDNGLSKVFSPGTNGVFIYPVGEDDYTPVEIDFGTGNSGTSLGSIAVRPANEFHPVVNDGDNFFASGDINNVLQYYWTLRSTGLTNFSADVNFSYDQSDVVVAEGGFTEADYIAAAILAFDNPTNEINKFSETEVDETANQILFPASLKFNAVNSNNISGDYFAGIDQAIPDNVATYTTQAILGDVTNTNTYVENLPTDGVAPSGAVLIVSSGTEVTFNTDNVRLYKTIIENGATLNIDDTDGHRLGILEGTGNLKITSNSSNAPLPTADYGTFFSCSGGGLEYAGDGDYSILAGISSLRRLVLSDDNGNGVTGVRNFPNNNVTICEDMVVDGPLVSTVNNTSIRIDGDMYINSGEFTVPGGNSGRFTVIGQFNQTGGVFNGNSRGRGFFANSVNIDGGNFNVGTLRYQFYFYGDISFNSGSFNGGSGISEVLIFANSIYNENNNISGDFTGLNSFNNLTIDKNNLGNNVFLDGTIEVSGELNLTDGKIISNGNDVVLGSAATVSPARGSSNSYITGKVIKPLAAGESFTFPIGSVDRWRPARINGVNAGYTWEAQFFEGNVVTDRAEVDDMSTSDPAIQTLQQGEYYVISDNSTGGTASSVELSWGIETDVAAGSADRGQLTVMVYNTTTSEWDNLGGTFPNGLGTQSAGIVRSASSQSFSEKIFIIGSTDAANPLPVEFTYFIADNKPNRVELNWQTASEHNNDFFEVQRSFDGKQFDVLGVVNGSGDSKELIDYGFIDYSPLAGKTYYRLRQVDFDGNFEYSDVLEISRIQETDLSAVPNPTSANNIRLRLSGFHAEQNIQVTIFDLQGRRHYQAIHSPSDLIKAIPINKELNSGIYIIDVKQANIRKKVRLMIK